VDAAGAIGLRRGRDGRRSSPSWRPCDLRHTTATLAADSGTSLKALMARIGHASAAAALRYQHIIDGQDAEIVRYLERFGEKPPVPAETADGPAATSALGHAWGTKRESSKVEGERRRPDKGFLGGDDRTRTGDPLLAK